jgi:fibronectin-binding autotransporter adhesin
MNTIKSSFFSPCNAMVKALAMIAFALSCGFPAMAAVTTSGSILDTSSSYYVGYTSDGSLQIDAGTQLSRNYGYLGYNSNCTGTATVTGTGSTWINYQRLLVGTYGSGTLNIDAGGHVGGIDGYLGYYAGSTGTATVTGTGSLWTSNGPFSVGNYGSGTLNIEAGGHVSNSQSALGYYAGSTGIATVTGTGSTWTIDYDLSVGTAGSGTLTVADGGLVTAWSLYASPGDLFGNGTITVHGAVLDTDVVFDGTHGLSQTFAFGTGGTLNLIFQDGDLGAGNKGTGTLRIADGSRVESNCGVLGRTSGSSGTATVTGTGSTWINNNYLYIGSYGNGTLNIQAGGQVNNNNNDCWIGNSFSSTGMVTVTGTGSTWTNNSYFYVGESGSGTLNIQAGGQVSNSYGYIADKSSSIGMVSVIGMGSTWTNNNYLYIGNFGSGTLNIEAGGQVNNYGNGYLGNNSKSTGTATVAGTGSTWVNGNYLYIGNYGSGTLNIQAGGQVINTYGYLGYYAGSIGSTSVTGTGSTWINYQTLYVGYYGTGSLTVDTGGLVAAQTLFASASDLFGNGTITANGAILDSNLVFDGTHGLTQALAFGTGGTLNLNLDGSGDLGAGYKGTGTLQIADGLAVSSSNGYLGYWASSIGTSTVTGLGSMWSISGTLYVGNYGSGTLTVAEGGLVTAKSLYASASDLFGNGTITVNNAVLDADIVFDGTHGLSQALAFGSGGTLNLNFDGSGEIGVGYKGIGTMRIADGLTVTSTNGYLGYWATSIGTATVTGLGSAWTISGTFFVGNYGAGVLNIGTGGQVSNSTGYIGNVTGSTGMVTVTGTSAKWTNGRDLYVGFGGSGTLNITAGGQVSSSNGYIAAARGSGSTSTTGMVTVTGTSSKWTNNYDLYVGFGGSGALNIAAGGQVSNSTGYIGAAKGSIYTSTATVTGINSKWTNSGTLYVGIGNLTVADGGKVTAKTLSFGNTQSSVRLHVSGNGMIVLGDATTTGSINNYSSVNLYADAFLPAGTYRPISEYAGRTMSWSGTGTYNAFGGTWNNTAKTFTVAAPVAADAGVGNTITTGERLLITDPATGKHAGASFGAVEGTPTFSAMLMSNSDLTPLHSTPSFTGTVLTAWNYTTNLSSGTEVMLSFDLGLGYQDPQVWHLSGSTWSLYTPELATYDSQGNFSFTVTSFSGYAVSAVNAVPEPAAWALLAAAFMGLGVWRGWRRGARG